MCHHVAFLVESHCAVVKGADIWSIVCMSALVREEFVQAAEHLVAMHVLRFFILAIAAFSLCFNWLKELIGNIRN